MKKILIVLFISIATFFGVVYIYFNTSLINSKEYNREPTGLSIFKNNKITIDIINESKNDFILKRETIKSGSYLKLRYNNINNKTTVNSDINGFSNKTIYKSKFINKFLSNDLKSCRTERNFFHKENNNEVLNFLITSEHGHSIRFDISKKDDLYEVHFVEENEKLNEFYKFSCDLIKNDMLITGIDLLIFSSLNE